MFHDIRSMRDAIERVENVSDENAFEHAISDLRTYMKQLGMGALSFIELEKRAFYISNGYSEKDTKEKMQDAKKRVIAYLTGIMSERTDKELVIQVLENFYLFLENLLEREPHKKSGINKIQLEGFKIRNEYDVQHLLYAYLKPLYPMARLEVNEDTGYGTVRADILLDEDCAVEIKCTRKGMSLKKLIEEIEADMVHYSEKNICFFIFVKEKIIENAFRFKKTYEEKMKDKHIHVIIHQPKIL